MFDNNNQNFNNNPFFNNNINNIGNESNSGNNNYDAPIFQNNNEGYIPPIFNNGPSVQNHQNFNNNIGNDFNSYNNSMIQNTNDNYIPPIFNNGANTSSNPFDFNQSSNGFVPSAYDVPPVLEEIKNLNNAPINSAPTLDVLGPMNIMPESFDASKRDILDAYDNGNMLNPSIPDLVNNQFNNMNNNITNENNLFEQPNLQNNMFEQPNVPNNNFANNSNMDFTLNQNIMNDNFNSFNNDLNFNIVPENNNFDSVMNSQDNNNLFNSNIINQNDILNNSEVSENNNLDIPLVAEENKEPVPLSDEINYDIVQDKSLQEIKEEETDLLSLGLDDSYSEPDMLEIMDIESEQLDNSNIDEPNEIPSVLDNVDKIKELVEELKNSGVDIQIEEFDFESMYQLIIKLNK